MVDRQKVKQQLDAIVQAKEGYVGPFNTLLSSLSDTSLFLSIVAAFYVPGIWLPTLVGYFLYLYTGRGRRNAYCSLV